MYTKTLKILLQVSNTSKSCVGELYKFCDSTSGVCKVCVLSSGRHACMYMCILSLCRRTICICGGASLLEIWREAHVRIQYVHTDIHVYHPLKQALSISVGGLVFFLIPTPPGTATNAYCPPT